MSKSACPDGSDGSTFDPIAHSANVIFAFINMNLLMVAVDDTPGAHEVIEPLYVEAAKGLGCPMKRFRALAKVVQESVFGDDIIKLYLASNPVVG